MVEIESLRKAYDGRDVLRLAAWHVPQGGRCCISGPSGSGKSTLLEIACALRPADGGSVRVAGTDVRSLRGAAADRWRGRTLGVVTQLPHLLELLSVEENVALPAQAAGVRVEAARPRALLEALGVGRLAGRSPQGLSPGERQRVALARALVCRPAVVIADEPTAHLDDEACDAMAGLLVDQAREIGATLLVATHDRRIVDRFEQRLVLLPAAVPA